MYEGEDTKWLRNGGRRVFSVVSLEIGTEAEREWLVKLMVDYEKVQQRLSVIAPDEGEVEVLIWPDCGDWIYDTVWERRW